jgi:hypothetical protein
MIMVNEYIAHKNQSLKSHLEGVAELCQKKRWKDRIGGLRRTAWFASIGEILITC